MSKETRQRKILEVIGRESVGTQAHLAALLRAEGFDATQATISRDIRELQLMKLPAEGGGQRYVRFSGGDAQMGDKFIRVLRDGFVSMDMAQNILVIRTVSGMAMAVAAAVDSMRLSEVIGCIAGDDTIFVAVRSAGETKRLMERLRGMIGTA